MLALRGVVVSNVQVRGAREYWRGFADFGVADLIDAIVTSLDVGYRKPHPAFFVGRHPRRAVPARRVCDGRQLGDERHLTGYRARHACEAGG